MGEGSKVSWDWVRNRVKLYMYESLPKDRSPRMCVEHNKSVCVSAQQGITRYYLSTAYGSIAPPLSSSEIYTSFLGVLYQLFSGNMIHFKTLIRKSFPINKSHEQLIMAPGKLGIMTPFGNQAQSHHIIMRLTEKERQCMVVTACIEGQLFYSCTVGFNVFHLQKGPPA